MRLFTAFVAAAIPALVGAAPRQLLTQHVPSGSKPSNFVERLPATNQMRLAFGLPLRNQAELTSFLENLYNPSSPGFRRYLTPQQFTDRFGPSAEDYDKTVAFLKEAGFAKVETHPNRMIVDAVGSVADVERVLHVKMGLHKHPNEARNFFAPDTEPTLDLQVRILHISGLDNYVLPRPASLKQAPVGTNPGVPQAGSGPSGTFMGADFRRAYVPGVSLNGTNQMVGLFELDGYNPTAIKTYETLASLPNVPLINVLLDDFSGAPGSGNVEVALDIEMAISMAPGLSAVVVYEGVTPNDVLNRMATDDVCNQLSASWTFPIDATTQQIYQQYAAQGQSYFNASGDNDAYSAGSPPLAPTDDPYVTSVGGTGLGMSGAGLNWATETSWNQNNGTGTGGGISTTYAIPSWQQGVDMTSNLGSTSMRNLPDVAMVSANVVVVYNTNTQASVVGTSIATPLWAGFTALANQRAASRGLPLVGFLNPAVYAIGLSSNYTSAFHDIKTGNNTNSTSPTKFFAVTGYDLCTGWGSPTGSNLINLLVVPFSMPVITNIAASLVAESCGPTNGVIDAGEMVTVNFSLQNVGGVPTTNLVATLLPGNGVDLPSVPQIYGALSGGGAVVARSFTFTASTNCGAIISPTLSLQDGLVSLGTVSFTMQTGVPVLPLTQNFDGVTAPALPSGWTIARSGSVSNWMTSITNRDTPPNAAFAPEATNAGYTELTSPAFAVATSTAQLKFRHFFNIELDPTNRTKAYDGGVLEIKVGTAAFADILSAGGTFVTGGYTSVIDPTDDNPFDGRNCWSGLSPGFITTLVNLPASAAGKTVQLKWRLGTDTGNFYGNRGGWYVDTIQVIDGYTCCTNSPLMITLQPVSQTVPAGTNVTFTVAASSSSLPLTYQWYFTGTNLPGAAATSLALTNVQGAQGGNYFAIVNDSLGSATSSVAVLRVLVPPVISVNPLGVSPTNVSVTFTSIAGLNYSLVYKSSLTDAAWLPIPPTVSGTGGVITLNDTNGTVSLQRFYRVLCN